MVCRSNTTLKRKKAKQVRKSAFLSFVLLVGITRPVRLKHKNRVLFGWGLGDWDNPYLTMNPETEADIVRALGRIASNGHLVKGYKPVYWSVVGASALAEAEVEYQDKQSFAIDVRFAAVDRDDVLAAWATGCCAGIADFRSDLDNNAMDASLQSGSLSAWGAGLCSG